MALSFKRTYLICYNLLQTTLWTLCFLQVFGALLRTRLGYRAFRSAEPFARAGQALAWMEVIHAGTGLAGGGVSAAFIQSLGRSVVLFAILGKIWESADMTAAILVLVWSLADVFRYVFYIASLFNNCPYWLVWLRYSLFLILYPIGIVSEWLIYLHTLRYFDDTRLYSINLPNPWNFAFDFGVYARIMLVSYLYMGPYMYRYMLGQRRRKLRGNSSGTKED